MRPWSVLVVAPILFIAIAPLVSAQTFHLSSVCATSVVTPCNNTLTAGSYAYLNGTGFGSPQGVGYVALQNSNGVSVVSWSPT